MLAAAGVHNDLLLGELDEGGGGGGGLHLSHGVLGDVLILVVHGHDDVIRRARFERLDELLAVGVLLYGGCESARLGGIRPILVVRRGEIAVKGKVGQQRGFVGHVDTIRQVVCLGLVVLRGVPGDGDRVFGGREGERLVGHGGCDEFPGELRDDVLGGVYVAGAAGIRIFGFEVERVTTCRADIGHEGDGDVVLAQIVLIIASRLQIRHPRGWGGAIPEISWGLHLNLEGAAFGRDDELLGRERHLVCV